MSFDVSAMILDWDEGRADPEFARFKDGASVHVLRTRWNPDHWTSYAILTGVGLRPGDEGESVIDWIYGKQTALCGEMGAPGPSFGISSFNDEDICVRCLRKIPESHQHRLFEHDQEGE